MGSYDITVKIKVHISVTVCRDLKANTVAAFYNGIRRKRPAETSSTWQLQE
jgi:hypothetical protein